MTSNFFIQQKTLFLDGDMGENRLENNGTVLRFYSVGEHIQEFQKIMDNETNIIAYGIGGTTYSISEENFWKLWNIVSVSKKEEIEKQKKYNETHPKIQKVPDPFNADRDENGNHWWDIEE